ncbi:MAG: hypothetical protein EAZ57_07075 [Cytophagales bacterium]|nr:MAG: hypothetical protein EAZ67_07885 [Cytophagales bacterium]TAF60464.1 MAG: hypothetical protein EAZ57_07075 [Cytophagales bacterium]
MAQNHIIKKIILDIDFTESNDAQSIHKKFKRLFEDAFVSSIQTLFDQHGSELHAKLDTLEIALGEVSIKDLSKLPQRLKEELHRALQKLNLKQKVQAQSAIKPRSQRTLVGTNQEALLVHLLEQGIKPWWADQNSPNLPALVQQFLLKDSQTLVMLLKTSAQPAVLARRLAYSLSKNQYKKLVEKLEPAHSKGILELLKSFLKAHKATPFTNRSQEDIRLLFFEYTFLFLMYQSYSLFNINDFTEYILQKIATKQNKSIEDILNNLLSNTNQINKVFTAQNQDLVNNLAIKELDKTKFLSKKKIEKKENYIDLLDKLKLIFGNKVNFNSKYLSHSLEFLYKFHKDKIQTLLKVLFSNETTLNNFIKKSNHLFFNLIIKNTLSTQQKFIDSLVYNLNYFHKINYDFKISTTELDILIKNLVFEYIFIKKNYSITKKNIVYFILKQLIKKTQTEPIRIFDEFLKNLKNPQNSFRDANVFFDLIQSLRTDADREGFLRKQVSQTIIRPYDDAELLRFYFTNGVLPWSSLSKSFDAEAIILGLLNNRIVSIRRLIYELSGQPRVLKRLIQGISPETLALLVPFFAPEESIDDEGSVETLTEVVRNSPQIMKSYLVYYLRQECFPNLLPLNFSKLFARLADEYLADAFLLLSYITERSDLTQRALLLMGEDTLLKVASFLLVPESQILLYKFSRIFPVLAQELEQINKPEEQKYLFWDICLKLFQTNQKFFDAGIWINKAQELGKIQQGAAWLENPEVLNLLRPKGASISPDNLNLEEIIVQFLKNLETPEGFSFSALEELLVQKLDSDPSGWHKILQESASSASTRYQWVLYFSEPLLQRIAYCLEPLILPKIQPIVQQFLRNLSRSDLVYNEKVLNWGFIFDEISDEATHSASRVQLGERFYTHLSKLLGIKAQILLNSLLPHLPLIFSAQDLQALKESFNLDEPIYERPSAARPEPAKMLKDDGIYIDNAGLVLLHPFMGRLFKMLELLEGKVFKSEEAQFKALHLLQYMVYDLDKRDEHDLVFNKILVGIAPQTPVPLTVELSEREKALASSLVMGAIQNWKALKNTSLLNFKVSFLQRGGKITQEGEHYRLTVEQRGYDLLLSRLPWSVSMIKQSWLKYMIFADWR